ncbi:MAG: M23 family metallopeptidase [Acidobacteria bacterium]|nr:M23 family metallopeptidase [Acidobacteriota bacterium]
MATACGRTSGPRLFDRTTPHEQYAGSLREAGLADTALARDWLAAAGRAIDEPIPATLPLVNDVRHVPAEPRAYGYRLQLQRGRVLRVELTVEAPEPALVFIDLFAAGEKGQPPRHVDSAERGVARLEHEIDQDGAYILRLQPELLRGGTLKIGQRTTAALTFPVAGRTSAAVQSFFLDPRDNNRREHHGIDIFAPRNTPVVAAADGFVSHVGTSALGGHIVWVWDPQRGQSHYYAHLEKQAVVTGERVRAGNLVGYVGNTGNARSTPPHLHFGIYRRGEGPIDPLPFVQGARGPDVPVVTAWRPGGDRRTRSPAAEGISETGHRFQTGGSDRTGSRDHW